MAVLSISSVRDTALLKHLSAGFSGADRETAAFLASNLITICEEAADRMRNFPSLHPEYTLHDEKHLSRVTEIMAKVLPGKVLSAILNPIEIALLILSAYFHDQGMVLESSEIGALNADKKFRVFRDNWEIEHPNFREVTQRLSEKTLAGPAAAALREAEQELLAALLTDFVRKTHGERSAEFIRSRYGQDPRWMVAGRNIAELTARLALSHVYPARQLTPANGFRHDESVGTYRVNMAYLGVVLRVADILDFDRDRTPDSLYRTVNFKSHVSLREWEKHRSVEGWSIGPDVVQYTMQCEHPEYQRAANEFMNWIDTELTETFGIVREFPAPFTRYEWQLPLKTDRSRIEPKGDAYIYNDLEFTLSRNEVVKLIMMDELYGGPWLCVRELLQNSLDALRYRRAMFKRDSGVEWNEGKVEFSHALNSDGEEVLRCSDNGSGMDLDMILRFLTKVGRSYYRSPEFEQQRVAFRSAGVDFDPCAQFGIGFMSCFMIGDRIRIETRRDYGHGREMGEPLLVDINGLSGMVVVRKGPSNQPVGTTVEITGREKPEFFHRWADRVRLIPVLDGCALACEFPIEGNCTIPGIAGSISIPVSIWLPPTIMESNKIRQHVTIEEKFSQIDSRLNGRIRTSFLADRSGHFSTGNSEAVWDVSQKKPHQGVPLKLPTGALVRPRYHDNHVCLDGILVAGDPRGSERHGHVLGVHTSPVMSRAASFTLDIRGDVKPPLTPARTPPDRSRRPDQEPRWKKIQLFTTLAEGRIWEQVAARCSAHGDHELFWELSTIYHAPLRGMRSKSIWTHVAIPVRPKGSNIFEWRALSTLGPLSVSQTETKALRFVLRDGNVIDAPQRVSQWTAEVDTAQLRLNWLLVSMCTLAGGSAGDIFSPHEPAQPELAPEEFDIGGGLFDVELLPYAGDISNCITCHTRYRSANREHPLARVALESNFLQHLSPLQRFASSAVWLLSDHQGLHPQQIPQTITPLKSLMSSRLKKVSVMYKYLGTRYLAVDWQSVPAEYAPPYAVRLESGETVHITSRELKYWAAAEVIEQGYHPGRVVNPSSKRPGALRTRAVRWKGPPGGR